MSAPGTQIVKNYTINTSSRTITFTDFTTIILERIALITDITTGAIIYQFNSTTVTGSVSTNVLTLSAMTGVTNTDKLRIDYGTVTGDPTYDTPPLPLGASTSALQSTGNTSLATIVTNTGNIPAKGAAATAASTPVNIASDQTVPVSSTTLATAANQTNASQKTQLVDASGNVVATAPANASTNGVSGISELIAGSGVSTSTITLNSTTPNTVWYDMLNYAGLSLEVLTNSSSATMTFQTTGDSAQTNAQGMNMLTANGGFTGNTTSSVGSFYAQRTGRYFRISSNVASSNTITLVLTFYTMPVPVNAMLASQQGTWLDTPQPSTSATGLTTYFNAAITGATATAVKTSAGRLHKFYIYNPNATVAWLQLFDLATGSVTVGTTTPKQSYAIPPTGVFEDFFEFSDTFATAITIATSTTVNGGTAPTTALTVNLGYI